MRKEWEGFIEGSWTQTIAVEEFIHLNYKPYDGDASFLAGPTERTKECSRRVQELLVEERKAGGTLKVDASRIMRINAFGPGYIVPGKDIIVGLQTDEPLKRGICPFGGIRMVREEVAEYGEKLPEEIDRMFDYITTHNDGVFKAYSKEMRQVRHLGFITGLPDAYGRGRIIGDYRRAALYGIDFLIEEKQKDHEMIASRHVMNEENIRTAEEISNEITALKEIKKMAASYGYDISGPAKDVKEAIQWTYFAYLAGIKEENGVVTVGLSDFAQQELGDLVFVNLPQVGDAVTAGEAFADVESVKAVSDVYSPVTGTVCEINEALLDAPESINQDPYGAWFIRVENVNGSVETLSAEEYEAMPKEG